MAPFNWKHELHDSIHKTYNAMVSLKAIHENKYNYFSLPKDFPFDRLVKLKEMEFKRDDFKKMLGLQISDMEEAINSFGSVEAEDEEKRLEATIRSEIKVAEDKIKQKKQELASLAQKQSAAEKKLEGLQACKNSINLIGARETSNDPSLESATTKESVLKEISQKEGERDKLNRYLFDITKAQEILKNLREAITKEAVEDRVVQATKLHHVIEQALVENDNSLRSLSKELQRVMNLKVEDPVKRDEKLSQIEFLKQRANEECCLLVQHRGNAQRELEALEDELDQLNANLREVLSDVEIRKNELKILTMQLSEAKDTYATEMAAFDEKIKKLRKQMDEALEDAKQRMRDIIKKETIFQTNLVLLKRDVPDIAQHESREAILNRIKNMGTTKTHDEVLSLRLDMTRELTYETTNLANDLRLCLDDSTKACDPLNL